MCLIDFTWICSPMSCVASVVTSVQRQLLNAISVLALQHTHNRIMNWNVCRQLNTLGLFLGPHRFADRHNDVADTHTVNVFPVAVLHVILIIVSLLGGYNVFRVMLGTGLVIPLFVVGNRRLCSGTVDARVDLLGEKHQRLRGHVAALRTAVYGHG